MGSRSLTPSNTLLACAARPGLTLGATALLPPAEVAPFSSSPKKVNPDSDVSGQVENTPASDVKNVAKKRQDDDDDFDIESYYARLHAIPTTFSPQPNATAGVEEESGFSEIDLNSSTANQALEDQGYGHGITSELAQNLSQLPQVLPQVANTVLSSFTSILNLGRSTITGTLDENRQYRESDDSIAMIQESQTYDESMPAVPLFNREEFPERIGNHSHVNVAAIPQQMPLDSVAQPAVNNESGSKNMFRLGTKKKKTYAHVPGLTLGEVEPAPIAPTSLPPDQRTMHYHQPNNIYNFPTPAIDINPNYPYQSTNIPQYEIINSSSVINAADNIYKEAPPRNIDMHCKQSLMKENILPHVIPGNPNFSTEGSFDNTYSVPSKDQQSDPQPHVISTNPNFSTDGFFNSSLSDPPEPSFPSSFQQTAQHPYAIPDSAGMSLFHRSSDQFVTSCLDTPIVSPREIKSDSNPLNANLPDVLNSSLKASDVTSHHTVQSTDTLNSPTAQNSNQSSVPPIFYDPSSFASNIPVPGAKPISPYFQGQTSSQSVPLDNTHVATNQFIHPNTLESRVMNSNEIISPVASNHALESTQLPLSANPPSSLISNAPARFYDPDSFPSNLNFTENDKKKPPSLSHPAFEMPSPPFSDIHASSVSNVPTTTFYDPFSKSLKQNDNKPDILSKPLTEDMHISSVSDAPTLFYNPNSFDDPHNHDKIEPVSIPAIPVETPSCPPLFSDSNIPPMFYDPNAFISNLNDNLTSSNEIKPFVADPLESSSLQVSSISDTPTAFYNPNTFSSILTPTNTDKNKSLGVSPSLPPADHIVPPNIPNETGVQEAPVSLYNPNAFTSNIKKVDDDIQKPATLPPNTAAVPIGTISNNFRMKSSKQRPKYYSGPIEQVIQNHPADNEPASLSSQPSNYPAFIPDVQSNASAISAAFQPSSQPEKPASGFGFSVFQNLSKIQNTVTSLFGSAPPDNSSDNYMTYAEPSSISNDNQIYGQSTMYFQSGHSNQPQSYENFYNQYNNSEVTSPCESVPISGYNNVPPAQQNETEDSTPQHFFTQTTNTNNEVGLPILPNQFFESVAGKTNENNKISNENSTDTTLHNNEIKQSNYLPNQSGDDVVTLNPSSLPHFASIGSSSNETDQFNFFSNQNEMMNQQMDINNFFNQPIHQEQSVFQNNETERQPTEYSLFYNNLMNQPKTEHEELIKSHTLDGENFDSNQTFKLYAENINEGRQNDVKESLLLTSYATSQTTSTPNISDSNVKSVGSEKMYNISICNPQSVNLDGTLKNLDPNEKPHLEDYTIEPSGDTDDIEEPTNSILNPDGLSESPVLLDSDCGVFKGFSNLINSDHNKQIESIDQSHYELFSSFANENVIKEFHLFEPNKNASPIPFSGNSPKYVRLNSQSGDLACDKSQHSLLESIIKSSENDSKDTIFENLPLNVSPQDGSYPVSDDCLHAMLDFKNPKDSVSFKELMETKIDDKVDDNDNSNDINPDDSDCESLKADNEVKEILSNVHSTNEKFTIKPFSSLTKLHNGSNLLNEGETLRMLKDEFDEILSGVSDTQYKSTKIVAQDEKDPASNIFDTSNTAKAYKSDLYPLQGPSDINLESKQNLDYFETSKHQNRNTFADAPQHYNIFRNVVNCPEMPIETQSNLPPWTGQLKEIDTATLETDNILQDSMHSLIDDSQATSAAIDDNIACDQFSLPPMPGNLENIPHYNIFNILPDHSKLTDEVCNATLGSSYYAAYKNLESNQNTIFENSTPFEVPKQVESCSNQIFSKFTENNNQLAECSDRLQGLSLAEATAISAAPISVDSFFNNNNFPTKESIEPHISTEVQESNKPPEEKDVPLFNYFSMMPQSGQPDFKF